MKIKLGQYFYPAFAALSVLLLAGSLACAPEAPAAEPAPGAELSAPRSTAASDAAFAPRSIAVSPELVAEFAAEQQAINENWDKFRADFDRWRSGLTACNQSVALAAFRRFAGDFSAITEQAKDLPGSGLTRELGYKVIEAATIEAAALRRLRDGWQPGSAGLLGEVKAERNAATILQRETADLLDKLGELADPEERAAAEDFSDALTPIDADWDDFHDAYDALREETSDLAQDAVIKRLEFLADDIASIQDRLEELLNDDVTEDIAEALIEAAEQEKDELELLRDSFLALSTVTAEASELTAAAATADDSANETDATLEPPYPTPTPAPSPPDYSDIFSKMDFQVEESDEIRKEARRELKTLIEGFSEEDRSDLADFSEAFDRLLTDWDAFHQDYDAWIRDEGGCDRAAAAQSLGEFNRRFNELSAQVRGLSQASYLRPASDLLVEAVAGEEAALRSLHYTWRPFETDLYRSLDQERINANDLRRLAGRRTQELVERFGAE